MLWHAFLTPFLCGLASALPYTQRTPGGCTIPEPKGAAPVPGNGSVTEYRDTSNVLSLLSEFAVNPTGYTQVFRNHYGSSEQIHNYLTHSILDIYDANKCATSCNKEVQCAAFNLYFERSPAFKVNENCRQPPPTTNVVCALYSDHLHPSATTNADETDDKHLAPSFERAIVGSNSYNRVMSQTYNRIASPTEAQDFKQVADLKDAAIESPPSDNAYLQYDVFQSDEPVYPEVCAVGCQKRDGCVFFNIYRLNKNELFESNWCSYYSNAYGQNFATNK